MCVFLTVSMDLANRLTDMVLLYNRSIVYIQITTSPFPKERFRLLGGINIPYTLVDFQNPIESRHKIIGIWKFSHLTLSPSSVLL